MSKVSNSSVLDKGERAIKRVFSFQTSMKMSQQLSVLILNVDLDKLVRTYGVALPKKMGK